MESFQVPLGQKRQRAAHKLVASVAKEMAGAVYEQCAKDNDWYRLNPSQKRFIEDHHGTFLEQARQVLGAMLQNPAYDEKTKEEIAEALIKDNELSVGHGVQTSIVSIQ